MQTRINIYMPSNKNYLKFVWVALFSLFKHNKDCNICVYLVSEDIQENDMVYLRRLEEEYNQQIFLIRFNADEAREKAGLQSTGRWPIGLYSCYWLFHYLLPAEVDKIMTLEADTVTIGSLKSIYNIDLEDNFAASQGPEHSPKRHMLVSEKMGGDFLSYNLSIYNVKKIREEIEFDRILSCDKEAHKVLGYSQQEWTFGLLFKGKIKYFPAKESCLHENCRSIEELGLNYIMQAEKKCKLLHFPSYSDNAKPWNPVYIVPGYYKWWENAQHSPYYMEYFEQQWEIYDRNKENYKILEKNLSYKNILLCTIAITCLLQIIYCLLINQMTFQTIAVVFSFYIFGFLLTLGIREIAKQINKRHGR